MEKGIYTAAYISAEENMVVGITERDECGDVSRVVGARPPTASTASAPLPSCFKEINQLNSLIQAK